MKPFAFAKLQNFRVLLAIQVEQSYGVHLVELMICDLCKASGFVITMEPLGFALTKQVNGFLLRVWWSAFFSLFELFLYTQQTKKM